MNGWALQVAGVLAMITAVGHGYFGDKMLAKQPIEPKTVKNFIRLCYQFGSAGWLAGGVLLFIAPALMDWTTQLWLVIVLIILYSFGASVNVWFTKGKHPGWVLLMGVILFAALGVWR